MTCRTLILYYLTRTTAGWTCCDILHYSKQRLTLSDNLTCTITLSTCLRRCARLSSVAATCRACLLIVELKLLCAAKYSFLKRNSYTETDICTLCRTISSATASSTSEEISENVTKNIPHIHAREIKATGSAACAIKCCMTKLIILTSLIRIRQYGIGLLSLLKLLLTLFITRMNVRMIFLCLLSEGFFNLCICSGLRYS